MAQSLLYARRHLITIGRRVRLHRCTFVFFKFTLWSLLAQKSGDLFWTIARERSIRELRLTNIGKGQEKGESSWQAIGSSPMAWQAKGLRRIAPCMIHNNREKEPPNQSSSRPCPRLLGGQCQGREHWRKPRFKRPKTPRLGEVLR